MNVQTSNILQQRAEEMAHARRSAIHQRRVFKQNEEQRTARLQEEYNLAMAGPFNGIRMNGR